MKKYNTKPIDFTGCHPVIAEHLIRGEAIECFVWDYEEEFKIKAWVYGYAPNTICKYKAKEFNYACAEPIPSKGRRIMPPERAIPTLIADGWEFTSTGYLSGPTCILTPKMYALMGGDIDGEARNFAWPDCIIEEVEDDE